MDGTYSSDGAPEHVAAFDDRELDIAEDGSFEWRFGPELGLKKGSTLIIREVYDDWNAEDRGTIRIQRLDTAGQPRPALTPERVAKRYGVAAKMLVGRINTWFAFPEWFTYKEPVNTLTVPEVDARRPRVAVLLDRPLLARREDQAMIVTVPVVRVRLPGDPDRLAVVHLHRLRAPPDLADQGPVARRPGREVPLRRQRAQPRHRQLAGDLRPPAGRDDAALAAALRDPSTPPTAPRSRSCRSTRWQSASPTSRRTRSPPTSTPPASPTARSASPEG